MKAALFEAYGEDTPIRIGERPKPVPEPDELLIHVKATTVTAVDSIFHRGESIFPRLATGLFKPKIPILGTELSGVVEMVGDNVTQFKPGDEVIADSGTNYGAHAEYIAVSEKGPVIHKPKSLTFNEASALCYGGLTALPFLRDAGQITEGNKLLVIGASGSVGSFAVQLAAHYGAEVTGVCSTANVELVQSLGADVVIDYTKTPLHENDQTYDIIFDSVGKYSFNRCRYLLTENGRYLTTAIGFRVLADMLRTRLTGGKRSIIIFAGLRSDADKLNDLKYLITLVKSGELKPLIDRIYPFDQIGEAFSYVGQGHKKGKRHYHNAMNTFSTNKLDVTTLKRYAHITGVLYLIVIICAGFSQGVVRESVYVAGDAAATAGNILSSASLFRWGLVTDLIAFTTDVAISVLLYLLLKNVNKPLAFMMAAFRLIAHPGVATANLLNHFAALKVLESPGLAEQFNQPQLMELSQFFMEAHHHGYILAGVTFGVHCLLLGYLLIKSRAFPTILGILMIGACFGYLTESFGFILYPEYKSVFAWIVGLTAAAGEVSLCFWLLIKGRRGDE